MAILFLVAALLLVLLHRLGVFQPLLERRAQDAFDENVLRLGEDLEWDERMTRMDRRLPATHKQPSLQFKTGGSS